MHIYHMYKIFFPHLSEIMHHYLCPKSLYLGFIILVKSLFSTKMSGNFYYQEINTQ